MRREISRPLALMTAALLLTACRSAPERATPPTPLPPPVVAPRPSAAATAPHDTATLMAVPDAVPRPEPRARLGNPAFYEVYGQRYTVLADSRGYVERGVASWYGPDFHGERTSCGEPYDMYSMTAAHRTLPLPAYARVTNLKNGRTVVVRINDRGPFKANRIIDLSYAAAVRLDMVRDGTTLVEVEAVTADGSLPPPQRPAELYAQAGAFGVEANATRLSDQLTAGGIADVHVAADGGGSTPRFRVRIGPINSVAAFDALIARLKALHISGATLVPY